MFSFVSPVLSEHWEKTELDLFSQSSTAQMPDLKGFFTGNAVRPQVLQISSQRLRRQTETCRPRHPGRHLCRARRKRTAAENPDDDVDGFESSRGSNDMDEGDDNIEGVSDDDAVSEDEEEEEEEDDEDDG